MKSIIGFLDSRKNEINLLKQENKLIKDAIMPLTSLGIPSKKLPEVIKLLAKDLQSYENSNDPFYSKNILLNGFGLFDFKILKLRKENRSLKNMILPYTSKGYSLRILPYIIKLQADFVKEKIVEKRFAASYHNTGGACSSPVSMPDIGHTTFGFR